MDSFNTQPPEGGWITRCDVAKDFYSVSTHSRLKAAGIAGIAIYSDCPVSTHSRLKAAGIISLNVAVRCGVSTHSRLKAAGLIFQ